MPLQPGTRLGPYEVLAPVGSGGMGEVYRARDTRLGRDVAIKVLPLDETDTPPRREQLMREARTASALSHPNICAIFDVGEADGRVFFAMELLAGKRLDEMAPSAGLPVEDIVGYGLQIAGALDHAHRRGVIHCDLKPANIIVTETGAKVVDFGIARRTRAVEAEALTRSLDAPASLSGTPAYMAPEQLRLQPADERTDMWGLGVVLYQLASGRLPFEGGSVHELASAVLRDSPAALADSLPSGLRAVIERCLRKDPAQRYQHASEVRAALEAVAAGAQPAIHAQATGTRDRRPARSPLTARRGLIWAALGLVLASGAASVLVLKQRAADRAGPVAKRLAVLPLRALNQQAADDYLGLGIADAVITKASQLPGLTVRPISAVRRFAKGDVDALEAARRLEADVVLDGSVQHVDQRVRASLNLLDARDGSSLWAESFDTSAADIFAIQDTIAREVAARLQVRLGPAERAAIAKHETANPEAYIAFTKAMSHIASRGWDELNRAESDAAIALFRQAISLDPAFARARAQLAYALAASAIFIEDDPASIEEAKQQLAAAERADPNLADIHVARALIVWSKYGRWETEAAIRELREAQRLDPSEGNDELASLYIHCGLDDLSEQHGQRALALDPTCENCKEAVETAYLDSIQPEKAAAARKKFWNLPPTAFGYLLQRLPGQAEPLVRERERKEPATPETLMLRALLDAEQERRPAAETAVRAMLATAPQNRPYHHFTFNAAAVFALIGKPREAVRLLKQTRDLGFFSYTVLMRDRRLDPIRSDPDFVALLAEAKTEWERLKAEFGSVDRAP